MAQGIHGGSGFKNVSYTEKEIGTGNVAWDEEGSKYIKCRAISSIPAGHIIISDAIAAVTERGIPIPSATRSSTIANTGAVIGVNDTGALLLVSQFFWCKVGPILDCIGGTEDSVASGALVYVSATVGEVDDDATDATTILGVAISATSGAATAIKILRPLA